MYGEVFIWIDHVCCSKECGSVWKGVVVLCLCVVVNLEYLAILQVHASVYCGRLIPAHLKYIAQLCCTLSISDSSRIFFCDIYH